MELILGCLIVWIKFQRVLKLDLGPRVLASTTQNQPPNDPVVRIFWAFLNCFANLFDCVDHVAFFELCERPVSVCVVVRVSVLGLLTYVDCLFVNLVEVKYVSQVVVRIRVLWVQVHTFVQVLNSF